jgi:DNA polymerase III delta subunit
VKIIVLHGDDSAKSYERLMKFVDSAKKRNWEIVTDEFPNTPSLFGKDRLIVYRNFQLLTKSDIKNFDKFDGTLVIYHDGVLPQTFLKLMPSDFKMEKFELPKILFTFLEAFYPGNSIRTLKLLHDLGKTEAIELSFFMLGRHLKDLYWVSIDPETSEYPSWRLSRLKFQAEKFGIEKLKLIINELSDIDIDVKSSKANLLTSLDLLIVKQLE